MNNKSKDNLKRQLISTGIPGEYKLYIDKVLLGKVKRKKSHWWYAISDTDVAHNSFVGFNTRESAIDYLIQVYENT